MFLFSRVNLQVSILSFLPYLFQADIPAVPYQHKVTILREEQEAPPKPVNSRDTQLAVPIEGFVTHSDIFGDDSKADRCSEIRKTNVHLPFRRSSSLFPLLPTLNATGLDLGDIQGSESIAFALYPRLDK